jgi:hypothetical protein
MLPHEIPFDRTPKLLVEVGEHSQVPNSMCSDGVGRALTLVHRYGSQ